MAKTDQKIVYLIDSSTLPKGGASVGTATAVPHPKFYLNNELQDGDTKVHVSQGDRIFIYTEEEKHLTSAAIAPNGIIAHSFNGTSLTVATMKDAAKRPIDIPNFDMDPGPAPDFIGYQDGQGWQQTPSSWSNWPNNPLIDQNLLPSQVRTYIPYVTFNASTLVSGELVYGVVFGVARLDGKGGVNVEYFYFDPSIVIDA